LVRENFFCVFGQGKSFSSRKVKENFSSLKFFIIWSGKLVESLFVRESQGKCYIIEKAYFLVREKFLVRENSF